MTRHATLIQKMPLLMTKLFGPLTLFAALKGFFDLGDGWGQGLLTILILSYGLWAFWESRISQKELELPESSYDGKSLEYAGITKTITLVVTFLTMDSFQLDSLVFGGCLLFFGGLSLRIWSVSSLGSFYRHRIFLLPPRLVMEGPYRYLRHPAYLGTWLLHIGMAVALHSMPGTLCALVLWGSAVVLRAVKEDQVLSADKRYLTYKEKTRFRLIPYLF